MAENDPGSSDESWLLLPDLDTSHRIIHAGNWAMYAALGFKWSQNIDYDTHWRGLTPVSLGAALNPFGPYGLYCGDAYDREARQPADAPGVGIYISPEGREHQAAWRQWRKDLEYCHRDEPDFNWFWDELVKYHHDVIHDDNWSEYAAQGFVPVTDLPLDYPTMDLLGIMNFYDGDTWDEGAGRPARRQKAPYGGGVYTTPEGVAHRARAERLHRQYRRRLRAARRGEDTADT